MELNALWIICCVGLLYCGGSIKAVNGNLDSTMPSEEGERHKMTPTNPWKLDSLAEAVGLCCDSNIYYITKCFERVGFSQFGSDPCGFQRRPSTVRSITTTNGGHQ